MKHLVYTIFLIIILISCKKNDVEEKIESEFVKGDVIVGINPEVQLEKLFTYTNSFGLKIDQISGYTYTTTIPKDSIPFIKTVLDAKNYIKTRNFSASIWTHYQTETTYSTTMLWDMDLTNQQDFIQTKNSLRMADNLSATKTMVLKVPEGQELYWIKKLKSFSWVRWAEPNWVATISPF